jgi:hypothetical protein
MVWLEADGTPALTWEDELTEPALVSSLELLQAIYRNPAQPIHRRMRAARAALPYENPKLAVVAHAHGGGFADKLEAAIKRAQGQARGSGPGPARGPVIDGVARQLT